MGGGEGGRDGGRICVWIWVPILRLTGRPGGEHDGVPDHSADRPAMPCGMHTPGPRRTLPSALGSGVVPGPCSLGTQSAPGSTPRPHPGACSRGTGPPRPCPLSCRNPLTAPRTASATIPTRTCHCPCHCPSHNLPLGPLPVPQPLTMPLHRLGHGGREGGREGGTDGGAKEGGREGEGGR